MLANSDFNNFFDIEKNIPKAGTRNMNMIGQVVNTAMGYRDIIYLSNKRLMFTCISDMSALSRIDSYFTNMDLPWEKKKPANQVLLSVGVIEALVQPKKDVLEFERIWCKSNKSQAICMSWSETLNALSIGYDSGMVEIISVDPQNPLNYKEMHTYQAHQARVMGIYLDGLRNLCYTISEDNHLKVMDIKVKDQMANIQISSNKLCV